MADQMERSLQDTVEVWPGVTQRLGGERVTIVAFVAAYLLLVWLGYQLKLDELHLTVIWPSAGLLMAALYLAPLRRWPVFIGLQLASEYAIGLLVREPSLPGGIVLFMLANTSDAVVGALIARSRFWRVSHVRITQAVQLLLATAAGSSVSATVGAVVAVQVYDAGSYALQWQLWWVGNWLGSIAVAPTVIYWALAARRPPPALRVVRPWEIAAFAVALAASIGWLFTTPMTESRSLLQTPAIPLALLLAVAFRLPPRWAGLIALCSVLLAAGLGVTGNNPFPGVNGYAQLLTLQSYLVLMAAITLIVSILVAAMKISLQEVTSSEARYRNFIAMSSEAVWRVEVDPPMPVALPLEEQRQWLEKTARVAEGNVLFDRLAAGCTEPGIDHGPQWIPARSWCALFEKHLEQAAREEFRLDGLRLVAQVAGKPRTFAISFNGVVTDGRLVRIWCVARDVSEIVDLNTRLMRERERLKAYAHQVLNAEERARRSTAKDLHDGIGQTLTGMAMSLEVARMQAPQVATLLDDVRANLRKVQDRTRNMIAELSPPGLYELGLQPALQWLVVHFRSQEKLRVQLDCKVDEDAISMELRVLVFKLVRELLRNVVKHSGVDSASTLVRGDRNIIRVEVEDTGRGFEWQMEMFGPQPGTFGLWSISDRVADVGGTFRVDTAPGHGSRFKLEIPLTP